MSRFLMILSGPLLGATLTACLPPPGPDVSTEYQMRFTVSGPAQNVGALRSGLVWYGADNTWHTLKSSEAGRWSPDIGGPLYGSSFTMNPDLATLRALVEHPAFATPFATGEASGKTDVVLSDPAVETGWLVPIVWQDDDRDGEFDAAPGATERVVYTTHDRFEYATNSFTYSFRGTGEGVKYRETGSIRGGWSRVRHLVFSPTATPGETVLSYESVDDRAFFLKEPTNAFTSMSAMGAGGRR